MTIDWHLMPGVDAPRVEIRREGEPGWSWHEGDSFAFPFEDRTYRYPILPEKLRRPERFATGRDTRALESDSGAMNRTMAGRDVDFVAFAGDLSYANGDPAGAWSVS